MKINGNEGTLGVSVKLQREIPQSFISSSEPVKEVGLG